MSIPNPKPERLYTYEDYLNWGEDERIEIIDGKAVMQAMPSYKHQRISGSIFAQLYSYLDGKKCEVIAAPFSVRLFETEEDTPDNIKTVVEPDIMVVCDISKIKNNGIKGAPDMVVEILSPSTAKYDMLQKLAKYQQARVKEYWIVDPEDETARVYLLEGDFYKSPQAYYPPDKIKVTVLDDCYIDLAKVFANRIKP